MIEGFIIVVYWKDKRDIFVLIIIYGNVVGDDIFYKLEIDL